MMLIGRTGAAWALAVALAFSGCAAAQSPYPAKPVRWLVPSAAGGAFDVVTRGLAPVVSQQMGQPFYVDNIAGASGLLGMQTGARADPDGYTILTAGVSQLVMNKFFYKTIPYDPVKDYAGVAMLADLPIALWVQTSVPVKSFPELVQYMKAHPNELNYGSAGVGHLFHLGMALLEERLGVQAVHIPYKGVGPAVQDFLAGRIQLMFSVAQKQVMAQYRAGKILPLVGGTTKRLEALPSVPTFDEMGVPGMDLPNWVGLVAPAGTPKEIIARLNKEVLKATGSEIARKTYSGYAMEVVNETPQQFETRYKRDIERWGPIIKKIGIEPH